MGLISYYYSWAILLQCLLCLESTVGFLSPTSPLAESTKLTPLQVHLEREAETRTLQHVGVPPILQQLQCGESIVGYRKTKDGSHDVTVERVSVSPPIFAMRNFATAEECDQIIQFASTAMEPAQTVSGTEEAIARKGSYVAWLEMQDANGLVGRLAEAIRGMMLMPGLPLACEPMQIVRYEPGGEYVLHHDGNDRILTVLYYINGEGETWFPLAQTATNQNDPENRSPQTRQAALDLAERLQPGVDGALVSTAPSSEPSASRVSVRKGDAVAFYSYLQDGSMDWKALHAGMPALQEKYIANHFIRYVPPRN